MTERRWLGLYQSVPPSIEPNARTGLDMFRDTVARRHDNALVHYFDASITAGQIDAWSDALAVALQERGAEPGERIAMYLQNIPQVFIAVLAAWKCGAVIVPCNPMLRLVDTSPIGPCSATSAGRGRRVSGNSPIGALARR